MNDKEQQEKDLNKLMKRLCGEKALARSIMEKRNAKDAEKQDDKTESSEE